MTAADLPRKLGLLDSVSIIVGTVIGTAIFIVPNSIAQNLPSIGMIFAVWAIGGVLSFCGALAYAELGAMLPATGGQYVYLREAYGSLWAFLCGWAFLLVVQSGTMAAKAAGFSIYLSYLVPMPPLAAQAASILLILVLTWINYRGVRLGAAVQTFFMIVKVAGLAVVIVAAFLAPAHTGSGPATPPSGFPWGRFGVAMVACLFAYEGWNKITFVAGEIRRPQRNLPLSLALSLVIVIAIYLLANAAYLRTLSVDEIAGIKHVSAAAAERTMGPIGATLVSLTILLSIVGSNNGSLMTSPRVYFAMARDGLFFRKFGEVHPRFQTPGFSILMQGAWASILAASGTFEQLVSYLIFAAWVFYAMTVFAVLVLRRKQPHLERPYRMWGYPVTPLLFAAASLGLVVNSIVRLPGPSLIGLGIIATGVPVYFLWRGRRLVS